MSRRIGWRSCVGLLVVLSVCALPGRAEVLPYGLKIEKVLEGSAELGDLAQAPNGELWLLERTGTVRVLRAGVEAATLSLPVSTSCESGLLDVAFDPDFAANGRALVYYVDATGKARVDEVFKTSASTLVAGALVLDLGTTPGGCRPGGGLAIGGDDKLYVGVGDLETSANGQDDGTPAGKILRAELNGSVPPDNASGTLVWAKGFRNGADLHVDESGKLYATDLGEPGSVSDEVNYVVEGGNYGWDLIDGDSGGAYDDPLLADLPTVTPEAIGSLRDGFGETHAGGLVYTCASATEDIRKATLNGSGDALQQVDGFYDPDGDVDGIPDADCPTGFHALADAGDGWLYGANDGTNPGVWRIWNDLPGPREVSGRGSPFPLLLDKAAGSMLQATYENLTPLDAYRPSRNAGQHSRSYQIWRGTLPIGGTYDHTPILSSNGTLDGPGRRTVNFEPGAGDHYFLMTAQGDNLEGSSGQASDGTDRPSAEDYCEDIGYGINVGDCVEPWKHAVTGEEIRLRDFNPNSPTYNQMITLSDYRGKVVRIDFSAVNCPPCQAQASVLHVVADYYRDRDLSMISVMNLQFQTLAPIPPANCASQIASWAATFDDSSPIVCDPDNNGDGLGDLIWQYWHQAGCGGVPQNLYIDQGHSIYQFVCGGETNSASITSKIINEINSETCE